jgi:hypothetical protein
LTDTEVVCWAWARGEALLALHEPPEQGFRNLSFEMPT